MVLLSLLLWHKEGGEMIIQEEYVCKNGVHMMRTYSDAGVFIIQKETGIIYQEAYDSIPVTYTYEETEIPVEKD